MVDWHSGSPKVLYALTVIGLGVIVTGTAMALMSGGDAGAGRTLGLHNITGESDKPEAASTTSPILTPSPAPSLSDPVYAGGQAAGYPPEASVTASEEDPEPSARPRIPVTATASVKVKPSATPTPTPTRQNRIKAPLPKLQRQ
jgi:hypothetical protein